MDSKDPAINDTANNNSTQLEHVPVPAGPAHSAVTSTSLPHLNDFITKVGEDAYTIQSLSSELERTKEKLREAEKKISQLEIDNQTIREDIDNARELLSAAQEDGNAVKAQLQAHEDSVEQLEAALKKWGTASIPLFVSPLNSRIINYKSTLDNVFRCDNARKTAFLAFIRHWSEMQTVRPSGDRVDLLCSRFARVYDALERGTAEARKSSA
ncbi:hypothetical protein QBC32DRAFT_373193 [Pseudoneurospora amorphoporcata]|uniref:Uncharacterized protein n=1 Tax=Pseudoneurospora amorphoporcata TaxID=241081 RepID=A0AAN6NN24_9PEZI|nr:hypothetical protein QBC32DRAFT_373193 [Pseudoneurospora amorphoporcata]